MKLNSTFDLMKIFYSACKIQIRKKSCKPLAQETYEASVGVSKRKTKKKKSSKTEMADEVPDIDPETLWRDSLTFENLKLFYKTQSGSFRKISNDESLRRLKSVLNDEESMNDGEVKSSKVTATVEVPCEKINASKEQKQSFNLRLPDLIIRNMTNFPMLRCNNSDPETLTEELKNADVNSYSFPAVTRILGETKSQESAAALFKWEQRMIAKLGEKGFLAYKEALLNRGTKFHSCIKQYLETKDEKAVELDEDTEKVWRSLEHVLPMISDVIHIEENVAHPILLYKGIVDCVASYQGVPSVIEWKKSDRKKGNLSSTYDAPLQCCAYLGALAWSKTSKNPVTNGLVVVGYTDGSPADVYKLDPEMCNKYWLHWLQRLQHYWVLNSTRKT